MDSIELFDNLDNLFYGERSSNLSEKAKISQTLLLELKRSGTGGLQDHGEFLSLDELQSDSSVKRDAIWDEIENTPSSDSSKLGLLRLELAALSDEPLTITVAEYLADWALNAGLRPDDIWLAFCQVLQDAQRSP